MSSAASTPTPRRGLGSTFGRAPGGASAPALLGVGGAARPRLAGLGEAVELARGRLPDALLDEITASVSRSSARLGHSDDHTVVAIAGSTGSGKSSTFNALVGREVSVAGAQRPTTSKASAVVCGPDDATELLDWLEVLPQHRHRFADASPGSQRTRLPDGLILLDLPDHDSLEVAHHEEAERIVALADLLVWVVDPQKYADAAIHRRFLRPLAGHRDVTIVVLNHIDTIPAQERQALVRDLRTVLAADGIRDPRILATSAVDGTGMGELRTAIVRRVEERRSALQRVEADVRAAAARLEAASGDGPTHLPDVWIADLERRVAEAAGVPGFVARAERDARSRTTGSDPDGAPARLDAIDRPAVDLAVRSLADQAARGLAAPWAEPVRRAATTGLAATSERLEAELAGIRLDTARPALLGLLAPARVGLGILAVCCLALLALAPLAGAVGLGVVALLLLLTVPAGRSLSEAAARGRAAAAEDACGRVITRVLRGHVVDPVRGEVARYARFHMALERATK